MYIGGSIHSIRLPHRFKTSAFFFFFLFAWIVFSLFGTLLFVYRSVSLNVGFFSLWANVSQLVSHSAHGQRVRERDEKKIEERLWESERDSKLFGNGPETLWFHERDRQRWNNIYRIYIRYSQQRRNRQLPGLCVCAGNYRAAALWLTDWRPIFFFFFFCLKYEKWRNYYYCRIKWRQLFQKRFWENCENSLFYSVSMCQYDVCDVDTRLSISKVRLMWSYSQKWNERDSQLSVYSAAVASTCKRTNEDRGMTNNSWDNDRLIATSSTDEYVYT